MKPLQFLPAQDDDLADIHSWPPYPAEFNNLDYALRDQGWIHEFYNKPHVYFYIAKYAQQALGFSLLAKTSETEAEFRIALHPEHIGKGIGKTITLHTLAEGFSQLNLARIYLIVRASNARAIRLYQSLGFMTRGKTRQSINSKTAALWVMDIEATRYHELDHLRSVAHTAR